jgi:hypothetical protein
MVMTSTLRGRQPKAASRVMMLAETTLALYLDGETSIAVAKMPRI